MGGSQKRAIIVSANRLHVERDLSAIRRLGLEVVKVFSSAAEAYNFLTAGGSDLVFCDHHVKDLDAMHFVRTVKASPGLRRIPVVMVSMRNDKADVLDAVAAGCSGYILRPYSDNTFEKHCRNALQLAQFNEIEQRQLQDAKLMLEIGEVDEAIEGFEELASMQGEAEKYYDMGCQHLAAEQYGKAIVAFQKAIRINDLFAEAYHGLAEAHKRRGDISQSQDYLKKAADLFAEADKMEKVKEVFIDILKMDEQASNPFNTLGVRLRKAGDIVAAVRAYKQALELTPSDENIYYNLAKAYYFSKNYDQATEWVTMALRINPSFSEAHRMYEKLQGTPWQGEGEQAFASAGLAPRDDVLLKDD